MDALCGIRHSDVEIVVLRLPDAVAALEGTVAWRLLRAHAVLTVSVLISDTLRTVGGVAPDAGREL